VYEIGRHNLSCTSVDLAPCVGWCGYTLKREACDRCGHSRACHQPAQRPNEQKEK
jgi:rRNA maturation protein Nop10